MRINPILDWTHEEVWRYLRAEGRDRPFCSLYREGFTSLGGKHDTRKHPALLDRESGLYRPAWELPQGEDERRGRGAAQ